MNIELMVCVNALGLTALAFLVFFAKNNIVFPGKTNRIFIYATIANIFVILLDLGEYIIAHINIATLGDLQTILHCLCFVFNPIIPLILLQIFINKKKTKLIALSAFFTNALICIVTFLISRLAGDHSIINIAIFSQAAVSIAFFAALLVLVYLKINTTRWSGKVFLTIVCIVVIGSFVVEITTNTRFLLWNMVGICLVLMYLYLHIEFLKNDILTNLPNRFIFEKDLTEMKTKDDLIVMVFDINNLKVINDTNGHLAGDELIIAVALNITKIFPEGRTYRIGGDEFVHIEEVNEKTDIDSKLQELDRSLSRKEQVSYGYAFSNNHQTLLETFNEADNQMYIHKNKVKNKTK